jgi:hypothetical protein
MSIFQLVQVRPHEQIPADIVQSLSRDSHPQPIFMQEDCSLQHDLGGISGRGARHMRRQPQLDARHRHSRNGRALRDARTRLVFACPDVRQRREELLLNVDPRDDLSA